MFCLHSDLTAKVQCFSVILNYLMHLPNFAVIKSIFQKIINKTSCTHRGHASSLWNNEGLIVDWYNIYLYLIKIFIKIMKHNSYIFVGLFSYFVLIISFITYWPSGGDQFPVYEQLFYMSNQLFYMSNQLFHSIWDNISNLLIAWNKSC